MTNRLLLILVGFLLLPASRAFAHRDYERDAGAFRRSDGQEVSIVEHYHDGIIAADPVAIRFRLPDGTIIAATRYATDAVIRRRSSVIEVFEFTSTAIPIAIRVQRFDGYSLTEAMTPTKQWLSPLVHTCGHWVDYLIVLAFATFLAFGWRAVKGIPRGGGQAVLRGLGLICVGSAAGLYLIVVLFMMPVSPFILLFIAIGGVMVFPAAKNLVQQVNARLGRSRH